MFTIEKNVPIPKRSGGGRRSSYPFKELQVGESFLVPDKKAAKIAPLAYRHGKALNRKFVCRETSEGARIWRAEDPAPETAAE